jgi:endonuclease G, mitochondrial
MVWTAGTSSVVSIRWGPDATRPGDDTFHFTNCAPQHERFNQGSDLWQGLENYILDHADARERRITVFTGPVLDEDDPLYRGVRLPLAYWKIIAYDRAHGLLAVAAYVLEQAKLVEDLLRTEARFEPGTYRVTLAHLMERTGLDFGYLRNAELPLSSGGLERTVDRVRISDDFSNIVL